MFGRGTICLGTTATVLAVPRQSLVEKGALTAVWTVDQSKTARLRLVKPGKVMGDRVEILAGLSDGERIVTAGGVRLSDGAKVE
jgi:multidrug efflux pump subunit AcrA (membrane-fusion protein)